MRRFLTGLGLALLFLIMVGSVALAQSGGTGERDPQFEQQIYDRLAKINPTAVELFKASTEALDAGQYAAAKTGYEQVLQLAPDFPDALRRLSYVEAELGDLENAEMHARRALALAPQPENQAGLAQVLLSTGDAAKYSEAKQLALAATQAEPDDLSYQFTLLSVAAEMTDMDTLRTTADRVIQLAPESPVGHYFSGVVAANDGNWEKSEKELLLAQQYGLPKEVVDEVLYKSGIHTQVVLQRVLRWGLYALAGWLVGLLLLFFVGWLLSRQTLKAVNREMLSGTFEISSGEQTLRRIYRVIISITSVYFYLSIPILIVVVVGVVAGIIYLFFVIGQIPVKLALIILIAGVYTLVAIVRSLFSRVKLGDPGRSVSPEEAPELWSLVREVAQKLGTRPVDAIYLTPAVEVAVTERGSLTSKLNDRSQRQLILGMGALSTLNRGELKAVLAHEYGHFNNRDTAGGTLAMQVDHAQNMLAYGLASRGLARWYNPAWWFINGYHRIFLRVTLGASRLQEILADRFAVLAYGARNLKEGLQRIIRRDVEFGMQVNTEVEQAVAETRGLRNLYTLPTVQDFGKLEEKVGEVMSRTSSPYDSHPSPKERFALMERIRVSGFAEDDSRPALALIPNVETVQDEMTAEVNQNLRERGILKDKLEQAAE